MCSTRTATGSSLPNSSKALPAGLEAAVGAVPLRTEPVRGSGYGTNTAKWSVELDGGRRVFVKLALDELAAGWLRDEARVYTSVTASFLPAFVAWHDEPGQTFLVMEDLSAAHWPPPWSPEQIAAVLATLDAVHTTTPPAGLPSLEGARSRLDGWTDVAADPEPFLTTGVCTRAWLDAALPTLAAASRDCVLSDDAFLHLDVRSDNLCFRGEQVLLVDWNLAHVGNPLIDAVAWLPSLRLEGGPEPWELVPDSQGLAVLLAGFFASRAGLPPPETAPTVREFQRRQATVALEWAARELGLTTLSA
jgi:aminoglycoside phosphotransferase (APT) family kinase protein